jgi:hypothetical protein
MADQELKTLVAQGLQALKAGGEVAKKATAEIQADASHPELQAALQQGDKTSEQWAQRVDSNPLSEKRTRRIRRSSRSM